LEFVLAHNPDRRIKVATETPPGISNALILKPEEKQRLQFVAIEDAEFLVSTLRRKTSLDKYRLKQLQHHATIAHIEQKARASHADILIFCPESVTETIRPRNEQRGHNKCTF